jgi:hypothetical protein
MLDNVRLVRLAWGRSPTSMRCPPRQGKPAEASRLLTISIRESLTILSFRPVHTFSRRGGCITGGLRIEDDPHFPRRTGP